jgi:hypothetical protein
VWFGEFEQTRSHPSAQSWLAGAAQSAVSDVRAVWMEATIVLKK